MSSWNDYESNLYEMASSSMSINASSASANTASTTQHINSINKQLMQRVILSSTSNVNLVHEILRNVRKFYFII